MTSHKSKAVKATASSIVSMALISAVVAIDDASRGRGINQF